MPLRLEYDPNPKDTGIQIWMKMGSHHDIPFRGTLTDKSQVMITGREERAFDMFQHINAYWSRLTIAQQEAIFLKVREIHFIMENTYEPTQLIEQLQPRIKELLDYHKFDSVKWWLLTLGGVVIPQTVTETYLGAEQTPGSRAQTYIRSDYEELITLSTILRVMYPIFMHFVYKCSRVVGSERKEMFAYMLMNQSYLVDHPSMHRIREYIDGCLAKRSQQRIGLIFNGFCSEDIPSYILSSLVVKKICCGDVRGASASGATGSNGSLSLPHVMWQFLDGFITRRNGDAGSRVTEKTTLSAAANSNGADEGGVSRMEAVKISTKLSIGDQAICRYSGSRIYTLAKRMDARLSDEILSVCQSSCEKALASGLLHPSKLMLVKYIFSRSISSVSFDVMHKPELIKCIAAAQALLWLSDNRTYKALAAILGARINSSEDSDVLSMNGSTNRTRVPVATVTKMVDIYRSFVPTSANTIEEKVKWMRNSDVMMALSALSGQITRSEWVSALPPEWIMQVTGNPMDTVIAAPPDTLTTLCELVIDINNWVIRSV